MNKYYVNRHNELTEDIKSAVRNMNYDIQELSKYCDSLENKIEKAFEYIKEEWVWDGTGIDDLINILQGSDKE